MNTRLLSHSLPLALGWVLLWSPLVWSECLDREAITAAEAKAAEVLEGAKSFRRSVVLHRHHPSHNKEVATYMQQNGAHYTLFFLVRDGCIASYRKRTRYPKY